MGIEKHTEISIWTPINITFIQKHSQHLSAPDLWRNLSPNRDLCVFNMLACVTLVSLATFNF